MPYDEEAPEAEMLDVDVALLDAIERYHEADSDSERELDPAKQSGSLRFKPDYFRPSHGRWFKSPSDEPDELKVHGKHDWARCSD